ncbi:MAG: DHHA1 domain-containing protein [Nanoarchaeota archaeon]|nr:DHHA1 domain-containing protein [Nanoarchaeota archaeon]
MVNLSFSELWKLLSSAKKVLISLHLGPDGDSLGSCLALEYVLKRDCKVEVDIVSKDPIGSSLGETDFVKNIAFGKGVADIDLKGYDLVILPDSGALKQFVPVDFKLSNKFNTVSIDHHASNDGFAKYNYVDNTKISCCSVLFEFFKSVGVKFDSELSTRLLLGIFTDSGFFAYGKGDSIKEAAFLIENGAEYQNRISDAIRFNIPLRIMQYHSLMIKNFRSVKISGLNVGYSSTSLKEVKSLNLSLSEARSAVNYLQELGGFDIIFTLTESEDKIKGSFRSRKGVDVSKYAEALEGGGHKAAAAFILPKMDLKEAERRVLDVLEN